MKCNTVHSAASLQIQTGEKNPILIKSTLNQHLIVVLIELLPTFLIFLVHFLNIADSVWIDNDQ